MHRYRYGHRVGFSNAEGLPSVIGEGLSCKNGWAAVSDFTIIINWAGADHHCRGQVCGHLSPLSLQWRQEVAQLTGRSSGLSFKFCDVPF
jgi:hypothetical protein